MSTPTFLEAMEDWIANAASALVKTPEDLEDFLDFARGQAWDIPSALLCLCEHDFLDGKKYPGFAEFPMHREPQSYWNNLNPWPEIDQHFKEVHDLDLTSDIINWNFDT